MSELHESQNGITDTIFSKNASYKLKNMDSIYCDTKGDAVFNNDDMGFDLKQNTSWRRHNNDRKSWGRSVRRKGQKDTWRITKHNDTEPHVGQNINGSDK